MDYSVHFYIVHFFLICFLRNIILPVKKMGECVEGWEVDGWMDRQNEILMRTLFASLRYRGTLTILTRTFWRNPSLHSLININKSSIHYSEVKNKPTKAFDALNKKGFPCNTWHSVSIQDLLRRVIYQHIHVSPTLCWWSKTHTTL